MKQVKLALLGFGNVGQAFAQLLLQKRDFIVKEHSVDFLVTGISTAHHGCVIQSQGINLDHALQLIITGKRLESLSHLTFSEDPFEFIRTCDADVLLENTPVNYQDGQPAVSYLRTALESGMHAITANKGPVVHAYRELTSLAATHQRKFYFESAVMDGAPIFSLFRHSLPAINLISFRGILNSTTNLILSRMESGEAFTAAVAYAQSIGIAETDPSGDIDGWDAAVKVAALVTVLMGIPLKPAQVDRTGIRQLTLNDIQQAQKQEKHWKLVCSAQRHRDQVIARVAPEMVDIGSPMYGVGGTSSIVTFETDVLPQLSIIEGNPGPGTTAYGLLSDLIDAVRTE